MMDENEELHRMYYESLPASINLIINPTPGLSPTTTAGYGMQPGGMGHGG